MHETSFRNMQYFVSRYLDHGTGERLRILDIGSRDVNGTYRPLFDRPGWIYTGLDTERGENVDIAVNDPYRWKELRRESFDLVISGQTLEHVEYFWITMLEIARVLKTGGLLCLIVPSAGPEHKYPVDCWRFYPDGIRALARHACLEVIDAHFASAREEDPVTPDQWHDTMLIARKNRMTPAGRARIFIRRALTRF